MRDIRFFTTSVLCCFAMTAYAQSVDDNVIISGKTEVYEYINEGVSIYLQNNINTTYECVNRPEKIEVVEFYDAFSDISSVRIKGIKGVTPDYHMYERDGVFFSDSKVCHFTLPFTKKGEIVNVTIDKKYNDISLFSTIYLAETEYVKTKEVKIIVPSCLDVRLEERNFNYAITKDVSQKYGSTIYTYNIADLPAIKTESSMPGYTYLFPYLIVIPQKLTLRNLEVKYFDTFDRQYQWCKDMAERCVNDTAVVAKKARELVAQCSTDDQKIEEVFAWVQNNIRYFAFEYGLAGYIPDNAQNVLKKKYGDCKGMANLTKELLCALGFDARLVWIGTSLINSDDDLPVPQFNHMICVLFRNDEVQYLDATAKYMRIGDYHQGIADRMALIENGDSYIRQRIPDVLPSQNRDFLQSYYEYSDGKLNGNSKIELSGETKQSILSKINSINKPQRDNVVKLSLERGNVQDKVSDIVLSGDDTKSECVCIDYREERRSGVQVLSDELYINLDVRKDFALQTIDTLKRKYDMLLPCKEVTIRDETLSVPDGYTIVSIPENLEISTPKYSFSITYSVNEGKINYHKEIILKDIWLKTSEFVDWNANISKLSKSYNQCIVLKKKQ